MSVEILKISHCRNIKSAQLTLKSGLNVITGANASGKTTLLEAFNLLGTGRSFRTSRLNHVIQAEQSTLTIFALLRSASGINQKLGFQYKEGKRQLRLDGNPVHSGAKLAQLLPIQLINQQSFDLIDQGPSQRRKFLDWGVFHVEQSFYPVWKRYMRAMKQRNAALRQSIKQTEHWEQEMGASAATLHGYRQAYVESLQPLFTASVSEMLGCDDITMQYRAGWDAETPLNELLASNRDKDRELGYSRYGPQRADLVFKRDGAPARERLSRGQQKLLVSALVLGQAQLLINSTGKPGTVLIDDISAELDSNHCAKLMGVLLATGSQLVVTAISPAQLPDVSGENPAMFHVEHGEVKEVV